MLELELQALKTELQSTLAHLSTARGGSEEDGTDPYNCLEIAGAPATAETNNTQSKSCCVRRAPKNPHRHQPITRWNRRQLTQELAAVSERRRNLETQLQREIKTQETQVQGQEHHRHQRRNRRRSVCQTAILELQQQRAQILRQMEHDTAAAAVNERKENDDTQTRVEELEQSNRNQVAPPTSTQQPVQVQRKNSETQYSIGGIITLEPLSSLQQPQKLSSMTSGVSFHPTVDVASVVTHVRDTSPRLHCRNTPDALNDVFLLQLKFAETMSKLEKSVQIRDQLLQHDRASSWPKSKKRMQLGQRDRHNSHGRQSIISESSSDSSVVYQEKKHSDESFSSSACSYSSLDSTRQRVHTTRMRHSNFGMSRATTAETLAPSTLCGDTSPSEEVIDRVFTVSASIATRSLHESPHDNRNSVAEHTPSDEQDLVAHRTPTTESRTTTPTTGSDQKSTSSLSKQVRFGDDAYSTPVLARKFNFDDPSIDEDDYEEKDEETASVLSFLGGSSVTSVELNDVSFLRAFERFRRELNASRLSSVTQSPLPLPLARKLFSEQNTSEAIQTTNSAPHVSEGVQSAEFTGKADACDDVSAFPALDSLSIEELQGLRRQLCLDIQAESAQLVLYFDRKQSVAAGSQDVEQSQNRLLTMREELKAVDVQLQSRV